jgi:hypothetical protein
MYYLAQEWLTVTTALSCERWQDFTRELLKKRPLLPFNILFSFHYSVSPEAVWFIFELLFSAAFTNTAIEDSAIFQAVSRRLPSAAARVQNRVWSCGILWWTKVALGQVSPRTLVSPANLHSICFSTTIFTITRGWHNRPGVAAVPIASQTK